MFLKARNLVLLPRRIHMCSETDTYSHLLAQAACINGQVDAKMSKKWHLMIIPVNPRRSCNK